MSLEEGDFKVTHENVVLNYLASKFTSGVTTPEVAAVASQLIVEAGQKVRVTIYA